MTGLLAGRAIFVADFGGAFGEAICRAIKHGGGAVVAGCSDPALVEGGADWCLPYDPAQPTEWERVLNAAECRIGRIDGVVNNPERLVRGSIEELEPEDWRRAYEMLDAAMLGMRSTLPRLRSVADSRLINLCSIAGEIGLPYHASYCATAFAIRPMTRSAAIHAAEKGYATTINCVIAGFERGGPLAGLMPDAGVAAEDVAAFVVHLLLPQSRGSNGAEFTVDRGGSLYPF